MNDDTTQLHIVATSPAQITAATEETEAEALVADLVSRVAGIRILLPSRSDDSARGALHEEIARMVATAQQLDVHLDEALLAGQDAATAPQFTDWLTAPGGER